MGVGSGRLLQEKTSYKVAGENPRGGSQEGLDAGLCAACREHIIKMASRQPMCSSWLPRALT